MNGFPLRKRDNVVLLLGAANRDPDVFVDPDRLDIDRRQGRHLSFGGGIHHCLGAPLARLEGRIVLEMLLDRFKSIRLLGDRPRFRQGIVLRGPQSLTLRCVSNEGSDFQGPDSRLKPHHQASLGEQHRPVVGPDVRSLDGVVKLLVDGPAGRVTTGRPSRSVVASRGC